MHEAAYDRILSTNIAYLPNTIPAISTTFLISQAGRETTRSMTSPRYAKRACDALARVACPPGDIRSLLLLLGTSKPVSEVVSSSDSRTSQSELLDESVGL